MLPLLTITTFLAAFLLFLVQPMVAKMALPRLGGSPAVWNTAMVVFQSLLLAGYAWAHWLSGWSGVWRRWAVVAQCALVVGAAMALPVGLGWGGGAGHRGEAGSWGPAVWLVGALLMGVGGPFVALASVSPTAQRWLAGTAHPAARDPYFLYAASNAGSLLALIGYPVVIERWLGVEAQRGVFSWVYGGVVVGVVGCAALTWRAGVARGRRGAEGRLPGEGETRTGGTPMPPVGPVVAPGHTGGTPMPPAVAPGRPWLWLFLAFTPSALMLGVTLHISTDLAAAPLLWVAPLTIYLLTFIVAFSRWRLPDRAVGRGAGVLGVGVVLTFLLRASEPVAVIVAIHLGFLFFGALVCHQKLADLRPAAERLTSFYLVTAVGGALGGVFASLVAPVVFESVLEYPVAIVLALVARGVGRGGSRHSRNDTSEGVASRSWWMARRPLRGRATPGRIFLGLRPRLLDVSPPGSADGAAGRFARREPGERGVAFALDVAFAIGLGVLAAVGARLGGPGWIGLAVGAGVPAVLLYLGMRSPRRFAFGAAGLLAAGALLPEAGSRVVLASRTFFGVHRVLVGPAPHAEGEELLVRLRHGVTPHGMQRVRADGTLDPTPLLYYHPKGPLGQLFAELDARGDWRRQRVGLIGLGVGATAAYAPGGGRWTFYEIDAEVVRIARDSGWFGYVGEGWRWEKGSGVESTEVAAGGVESEGVIERSGGMDGSGRDPGGTVHGRTFEFVVGDGRLEIGEAPDGEFGMIVLDAFSSDAIPTHLLTHEAVEVYRRKLAPGGLIVLHISNRRLDLAPIVAAAARDLGMVGLIQDDVLDDPSIGKWPSTWVALGDAGALDVLRGKALWRPLEADGARAWTDDYADILRVMRWW